MKQLTNRQTAAALIIAAIAAWRLPNVYGLACDNSLFAGSVITLILLAGLFLFWRISRLVRRIARHHKKED